MRRSRLNRGLVGNVLLVLALSACGNERMPSAEQGAEVSQAFTDVSNGNVTDQSFFAQLNYSVSGMGEVKEAVDDGDYATAKARLREYFRQRAPGRLLPYTRSADLYRARLEADDFYFTAYEYPVAQVRFRVNPGTVSTLVTDVVQSSGAGLVSFMLMGRTHSSDAVTIRSRESAASRPRLRVKLASGATKVLEPVKDATIRGLENANTNYGSLGFVEVKEDAGVVVSGNTRRAYLTFDLAEIGEGQVETATLELYGSANLGNCDVVVMVSTNTGYDERTITWNNVSGGVASWTGISGGTDWTTPPGLQTQFLYGIVRFEFADNLAVAYQASGDETYARGLTRVWLDFISDVDTAAEIPRSSNPWRGQMLDSGLRGSHWLKAYEVIRKSSALDVAANTAILKHFTRYAAWLASEASFPRGHQDDNWGYSTPRALYELGKYFPEFSASGDWVTTAKARIEKVQTNVTQSDGSFSEADTFYAAGVAEAARGVRVVAGLNDDSFSSGFDDRLQRLGTYIMDFSRPDGTATPFGDSDPVEVASEGLSLSESFPARTDLRYFGSYGTEGQEPGHTSSYYPVGKTAFMKTGYGPNDLFMSIDLNAGTHAHPDLNAITLYAYGRDLLVDPGRYNYNPGDEVSEWLRETTESHNTIEIDGVAQSTNASRVRNVEAWSTNGAFDFFEGTHEGYASFLHTRGVFFSRTSNFWIVSDYIKAPAGSHNYKQTWHLLPTAELALAADTKKVSSHFATGANIQIVPADPTSFSASLPTNGYYSPRQFSYSRALYASYLRSGVAGDQTFDTVLYPTQGGSLTPEVTVTRLTETGAPATTATALKVALNKGQGGNIGYYYLSHEATPSARRSFGTFSFNGKCAYVETRANPGTYVSAAIKGGTFLRDGATILANSPSVIPELGIRWLDDGRTLDIQGESLVPEATQYAVGVYAPAATKVLLNGRQVPFAKSDGLVYAARAVRGFNPTDDAYVRGGADASSNYAVDRELAVKRDAGMGNERRAYLKFDFSSFSGAVTSAKLRLHVRDIGGDATRTVKVYSTADFSENTLTFANRPAPGSLLAARTIASTDIDTWIVLDVTSYAAAADSKKVLFYIANEGPSNSGGNTVVFSSKDAGDGAKPMLVIN